MTWTAETVWRTIAAYCSAAKSANVPCCSAASCNADSNLRNSAADLATHAAVLYAKSDGSYRYEQMQPNNRQQYRFIWTLYKIYARPLLRNPQANMDRWILGYQLHSYMYGKARALSTAAETPHDCRRTRSVPNLRKGSRSAAR